MLLPQIQIHLPSCRLSWWWCDEKCVSPYHLFAYDAFNLQSDLKSLVSPPSRSRVVFPLQICTSRVLVYERRWLEGSRRIHPSLSLVVAGICHATVAGGGFFGGEVYIMDRVWLGSVLGSVLFCCCVFVVVFVCFLSFYKLLVLSVSVGASLVLLVCVVSSCMLLCCVCVLGWCSVKGLGSRLF